MTRGESIYNYPLWSLKRLPDSLKYKWEDAKTVRVYGMTRVNVFLDMLWSDIRYGAMGSRDYVLFEFYKKSGHERNTFFTKRRYFRLIKHFDKDLFLNLCEKDYMYKKYKSFIKRDWMHINALTTKGEIMSFLMNHGSALLKPVSSEQGHGIAIVDVNDIENLDYILTSKGKESFILEQLLTNESSISAINSRCLNTIRFYTIVKKTGEIKVIAAFLRCGVGDIAVDNWGAGGIGYPIDVETGVIYKSGVDKKNNSYTTHPGSDMIMVGMMMPYFTSALNLCKEIIESDKRVVYAGIDIAITPNGPEMIEINFPGGHDFLQAVDSIGKNELMRTIYK